jgi:hypothetical protein
LRADLGAADATTLAALFAEFHDHV